jgi:hypothetical protein
VTQSYRDYVLPLYNRRVAWLRVPEDIDTDDMEILGEFLAILKKSLTPKESWQTKPAAIDSEPQLQVESEAI